MKDYEIIATPTPNPDTELRDKIAAIVFEQIIIGNGMKDTVNVDKDYLSVISKGLAKVAQDFADDFMRERYERMCVKATGINLEDLVKK